jgi:uncharacterized membrane protein YfcA
MGTTTTTRSANLVNIPTIIGPMRLSSAIAVHASANYSTFSIEAEANMRKKKSVDWRKAILVVIALLTILSMVVGEWLALFQPRP